MIDEEAHNHSAKILPGIGLESLRFGVGREDARLHLGDPDEIEENWSEAYPTIAWYYWDRGLSLHFHAEDGFRLTTIDIDRENAEFMGLRWIGVAECEVRERLNALKIEFRREEMGSQERPDRCLFSLEAIWVNLWCECGQVTSIQWSCFIGDDDEFLWPEQ